MGRRSEFCSFSTTHLSVTVVTSLTVSVSPLTFLRFIAMSTVGHRPIMPTGFMSPIVWLLTTGTSSFPGGMESVVQRCAAECRIVAGDGWVWRRLEGPCHGASGGTHLHLGCSSYTDPYVQPHSHQIIFDTPEDYNRQDLFTNTQNTSTLKKGGGDSSVVRAPDSWLKGRGFESLLERRENFLLQGWLSVLTLISVSVPPPCYRSST